MISESNDTFAETFGEICVQADDGEKSKRPEEVLSIVEFWLLLCSAAGLALHIASKAEVS